jgi:filamentous hemagglutinin family protein
MHCVNYDSFICIQADRPVCTGWQARLPFMLLLVMGTLPLFAGPTGPVVAKGAATFSSVGSTFTIQQTTPQAVINWGSFNIGLGETMTFNQPSSSSVTWNRINDVNPSQILGTLNANGYVVLQNASGIYIGGQATINVHGLLMTTSPIPVPDISSGGPWQFNALPPTASIINYGQITTDRGGSVFLIAHDVYNNGTINAPQGNIGLYSGQEILVSDRPDGRGLSARVTLPQGSVNNAGSLIADAGSIAMHAQVVNQGGLVQANSVRQANGVIELVAGDTLNLSDSSVISAVGDASSAGGSQGGFVTLKAGNAISDSALSTISVAGANGGQGGILEILCSAIGANGILSTLDNPFAVLINPFDITISGNPTDASSQNPNLNTTDLGRYSRINLEALDNIEISARFSLAALTDPVGMLSLQAAHNIQLDPGANITAGKNWAVNMTAGTELTSAANRQAGSDGIYLLGDSFIQTQNGMIDLWAANEVIVNSGESGDVGNNGIRTEANASIYVKTLYGDVNTGGNTKGFRTPYRNAAPFYSVLTTLGGISTAAGGDVNIDAGGNVISYLPNGNDPTVASDGGSGAFGPLAGNVTINAGGSVYGHFMVANGSGTISAGQDIGGSDPSQNVALSLIKGSWALNAPNGNIYLQEVRNPNGVFNNGANNPNSAGYHLYNYDPGSSVSLTAVRGVYITGLDLPRSTDPAPGMIFPPILDITAGSGGITLGDSVILFPSALGNLNLKTTDGGNLQTIPNNPALNPTPSLILSDSAQTKWLGPDTFGIADHGPVSADLINCTDPTKANCDPVIVNVNGNMNNLILVTTKETQITVGGDMVGCSFSGQNLHGDDVTSIDVGGQIFNRSPYSKTVLDQAIPPVPYGFLPPFTRVNWSTIFGLAMNPDIIASLVVPKNQTPAQLATLLATAALFPSNPGFLFNPTTKLMIFNGQMSDNVKTALENPLTLVRYKDGLPVVDANNHFVTDTVSWGVPNAAIDSLYASSQGAPSATSPAGLGYEVGGPGYFNVHANSISLGNTYGILASGVGDQQGNHRFANLAKYTPVGAALTVNVDGNLDMSASTIASIGGGPVKVTSTGGSMTLGSQDLADLQEGIIQAHGLALGIFSSGYADVTVTAYGDINVDSSRIAAYNGGTIGVTSQHGSVDAGRGTAVVTPVVTYFVDPVTGSASSYHEIVIGSGIVATTLADPSKVPGSPGLPGNIDVETPQGNIVADLGGISQTVINGTLLPGPKITLVAGTKATEGSPGYVGNIELGNSGVIGGTVNLDANGSVTGLVISKQNTTINAAQNFNGTVLAGGTANLSAGGGVVGTIVGIAGVNASGGAGVTATVLSQNASVNGGTTESTLGTSATPTAASQSAAQQSSSDAKQQVASTDRLDNPDQKKQKKPVLTRRSRVTVILPNQG